ncbi:MAG TPA: hypothetical protein VGC32_15005 [Solirubrobacterales bacterium]
MAEPQQPGIVQVYAGDLLLAGSLGLLAALGDAATFPQDRAGIEALIERLPEPRHGIKPTAGYEAPGALPTYRGSNAFWLAPAGDGRLRLRQRKLGLGLASEVFVLGPDGSLSDPVTIEGYGVPDGELTEAARGELAEFEERRRAARAREPEERRREEERRTRFQVEHLRAVIAGPPDQDPAGPVVTYIALYDDGLLVDFLMPRPADEDPRSTDPGDLDREVPQEVRVDDGEGTEFKFESGSVDRNAPILRGRRRCARAPAPEASRLRVTIESTVVEIDLAER